MSVRSVYIPDPAIASGRLRISGDEHQHLKVARAEVGETIEVFDGKGGLWTVEVVLKDLVRGVALPLKTSFTLTQ